MNDTKKETGTAIVEIDASTIDEQMLVSATEARERIVVYQTATERDRLRVIRVAATQMGKLQWGTELDAVTRGAIARWALEAGIDPVRHIDILGNRIYDNAKLYLDACAAHPGFVRDTVVLLAPLDRRTFDASVLLADDIEGLKLEQKQINAERYRLQMQYGVPTKINEHGELAAAALVTLYFKGKEPAEGVNWAGRYGQGKKDPVGEQHPVKTAITRAYRKAALKRIPVWFKEGDSGVQLEQIETDIKDDKHRAKAQLTGNPTLDGRRRFLSVAGADGLLIKDTTGDRVHAPKDPYEHGLPEPSTIEGLVKTGEDDPYHLDCDGSETVDVVTHAAEVHVVCEHCGNWDAVPVGDSLTPECSASCGHQMRAATGDEIRDNEQEQRMRHEEREFDK